MSLDRQTQGRCGEKKKNQHSEGVKSRAATHPDPQGRAEELMEGWVKVSFFAFLPCDIQTALSNKAVVRRKHVNHAISVKHESETLIT